MAGRRTDPAELKSGELKTMFRIWILPRTPKTLNRLFESYDPCRLRNHHTGSHEAQLIEGTIKLSSPKPFVR